MGMFKPSVSKFLGNHLTRLILFAFPAIIFFSFKSENLVSVLNKEEASVDTPEEYLRVHEGCNGETARIFDQIAHQ